MLALPLAPVFILLIRLLTCNHLFFADDVKLIAPRSKQHKLRSSIQQALSLSRRWDLPLNASKSHHPSIGGPPDHRLVFSEETEGKLMTQYEQINDLGIIVNSAFTPSTNVLAAANKDRGMLYFKKRLFMSKEIFVPLYSALVRPHLESAIQANCPYLKNDIFHVEIIQRAATRWVKGLRDFNYEDRLKELKLQSLEKRRIRNDLALPHEMIYNQLFKVSRRPGLRRSSLRLLQQTGRTRRRRNSSACRVVKYWNRLPLVVASVPDHLAFKRQLDTYIYP